MDIPARDACLAATQSVLVLHLQLGELHAEGDRSAVGVCFKAPPFWVLTRTS
jgi:hypothetical protein